ncbi:hypothetical protein BDC45DRAFT_516490 [Circinella umbellata]|nr:hypothetical protein BDC45DRAFT_516490 [Circinella umbellata]
MTNQKTNYYCKPCNRFFLTNEKYILHFRHRTKHREPEKKHTEYTKKPMITKWITDICYDEDLVEKMVDNGSKNKKSKLYRCKSKECTKRYKHKNMMIRHFKEKHNS